MGMAVWGRLGILIAGVMIQLLTREGSDQSPCIHFG
jgi:hypothetical protein